MCPINPNIALQAQPAQMPDLMQQMGQIIQLKNLSQQNKIGQIQLQETRQRLDDFNKSIELENGVDDLIAEYWDNIPKGRMEAAQKYGGKGIKLFDTAAKSKEAEGKLKAEDWQRANNEVNQLINFTTELEMLPDDKSKAERIIAFTDALRQSGAPEESIQPFANLIDPDTRAGMVDQLQRKKLETESKLQELGIEYQEAQIEATRALEDQRRQPAAQTKLPWKDRTFNAWKARPGNENKTELDFDEHLAKQGSESDLLHDLPIDPDSKNILAQTGLHMGGFAVLTNQTTKLLGRGEQARKVAREEAEKFSRERGVDVALMGNQYEAFSDIIQKNMMRQNMTKIFELEMAGTIENMATVVDEKELTPVRIQNILDLRLGKEVNDPLAARYAFHLEQLVSEYAGYNAAAQGRYGAQIDKADNERAAEVIYKGLSEKGLAGISVAVKDATEKIDANMEQAIRMARKGTWSLFGLDEQYKNVYENNSDQTDKPQGNVIKWGRDANGNPVRLQ